MAKTLRSALLLAPSAFLIGVFLIGLVRLIASSVLIDGQIDLHHYVDIMNRPDYVAMLGRTLRTAALTTFFCLLLGYPTAYYVARYQGNRNILLLLIIFPWLVSIVVRSYGWVVILGPRGLVNGFLMWTGMADRPFKLMYNDFGVVMGLVHVLLPFMIIAILSVLMQISRTLEEASMSLGGRPVYSFRTVLLPLSLPGILTGVTLVYLMSTGAIVTPLLLGGLGDTMIGTEIFQEVMHFFDYPKAAALATVLLVTAMAVVLPLQFLERWLSKRLTDGAPS
ncbi:ABC transporter permease [uncultured Pseudosulfitobacter sp.]|jgi:putative spermidine/putrescine transport system permease protein|uniref:ABC transporter permease n=1 Tax=uncultured Pseudosulfitobacter sp. TaxID=2854214 RepID=UPI0030D78D5C|tara:strand:+ start:3033 stop:3872 length:840 start_codon:yes stop_codon:yes gene_type:complete